MDAEPSSTTPAEPRVSAELRVLVQSAQAGNPAALPHIRASGLGEVRFSAKLAGLAQTEDHVEATISNDNGAGLSASTDHQNWKPSVNPWLVAVSVMLATFMVVLDSSVANVALPHIAGNLSASTDESTWVLTSYLVSNAIKYVAQGVATRLEISARRSEDAVQLLFRDNGIGLKPEDQQRLFTPFVRLHRVEDYPGVGLGLSAARKVVEIIGGHTGVNSAPGQGSTFWIELAAGSTVA